MIDINISFDRIRVDQLNITIVKMFIKNTKLISKYENYYTQTNLILPFKGRWHVLFGGRNASFNYHRAIKPQMFAIDFDIQIDCKNYSHNGSLNQHYYCFDKPIICPGDGQVIFVENSILDNTPKFTNTDFPYGNLIIIDHNNGEYSFISQLKYQSIQVRQGMDVKQGEILARCGNMGWFSSNGPNLSSS